MAGIDASAVNAQIPLQTRTPSLEQALSPISTMLDITRKRQAVQVGEQQVQQAGQQTQEGAISLAEKQYSYGAQQRIAQVLQDPANHKEDGSLDLNKLPTALYQADPRNVHASKVFSDIANGQNNLTIFKTGYNNLTKQQQDMFGSAVGAALTDPKPTVDKLRQLALDQKIKMGDDPAVESMFSAYNDQLKRVAEQARNDPEAVRNFIKTTVQHTAGASALAGQTTPQGGTVSTPTGGYSYNTNPLSPLPQGGLIPGSQYQAGQGPTTQEFREAAPGRPAGMYMIGPQPAPQPLNPPQVGIPGPQSQQAGGPQPQPAAVGVTPASMSQPRQRAAAPPLGEPERVSGIVGQAKIDYDDTVNRAKTANNMVPVLQKIQQYVPDSAVGVTTAREQLVDALAGKLGMSAGELRKTSTDVLQKQMAQLVGGNSDMARSFSELANPHVTMTRDAIQTTAKQLNSVAQVDLAKQKFMQPFTANENAYAQKLVEWNNNANPNVVLWKSLNERERDKLITGMSAQERQRFRGQYTWAKQNGLIQ